MIRALLAACVLSLGALPALAQAPAPKPAEPDLAALIQANSYAIAFDDGRLTGPGAAFLDRATDDAQFVLIGESHFEHDTPLFADALFRMLERDHDFHHLVVEQDGVGMEDILKPGVRGNLEATAAVAKAHPTLIGFASDQDLAFLADVAAREKGPSPIWGVEQTQGAARYLEELDGLAPSPQVRAMISPLLAEAKKFDTRETLANFLALDTSTLPRLQALQAAFKAAPGSRADRLLTGLVKSAEIYSYYVRAEAGEPVGLFNNTVRETWLKAGFLAHYRAEATDGKPLKAVFKFGAEHMIHGLDSVSAFPIGNFAHEFAISNGMTAYSIQPVPTGRYAKESEIPGWMRVVMPKTLPDQPVLIDLRALRPYQRYFRQKVAVEDQWQFRAFVNGYDAIVLLPNARMADFKLTGFPEMRGN
jgi:hypothetical protein